MCSFSIGHSSLLDKQTLPRNYHFDLSCQPQAFGGVYICFGRSAVPVLRRLYRTCRNRVIRHSFFPLILLKLLFKFLNSVQLRMCFQMFAQWVLRILWNMFLHPRSSIAGHDSPPSTIPFHCINYQYVINPLLL